MLQFTVDHVQRSTADGLVHQLPPALDQALVNAGIKAQLGALSLATIVHRVAVMSKAHQLLELKNPCLDVRVRELLAMTRRAYAKRGVRPRKKDALTANPLAAALATCDDSLVGKRDRAIITFGWGSGGRRRSEVAQAEMANLHRLADGEFTYELVHSKTVHVQYLPSAVPFREGPEAVHLTFSG